MVSIPPALRRLGDTRAAALLHGVVSFFAFALRRFFADRMSQAAGALTYSTLLAIVPLMVIAFAIISGFPAFDLVRERMESMFIETLVPEVGNDVQDYLTNFTHNAGNLTSVGIVALALTAVLLLSTIETTLNRVWRVERPRPLAVQLLIFWTILTLGPLLLGASFTATSDIFERARHWALDAGPIGVIDTSSSAFRAPVAIVTQTAFFTMLYMIVPARRVTLRDALIGGLIAGLAFETLKTFFNLFITSGDTYSTIYGAVAVFPIFLIWVYASWTVIIFGAVCAAAVPDWWRLRNKNLDVALTAPQRLEVAVALLGVLSSRAQEGGTVPPEVLARTAPLNARDEILEQLRVSGWVVITEEDQVCLSRDLHTATLADLAQDLGLLLGRASSTEDRVDAAILSDPTTRGAAPGLLERLHRAEAEILGQTIAEVLENPRPSGDGTPLSVMRG